MIEKIRNFAIIAHIDHGKSTLADRFLEITKTVSIDKLQPQYLDQLSLERERGITIKMQPVTMNYNGYILNLIDTPGHVDFHYEVSRALAAVEGVILLIDGTQGIQAQTIANLELAKEQNLKIIPAINKIDLIKSDIDDLILDIYNLTGEQNVFLISGKTGSGVQELLQAVIDKIPPPSSYFQANDDNKTKALIFDSHFDPYKGIIAHFRLFRGRLSVGDEVYLNRARYKFKIVELGIFKPEMVGQKFLDEGMIGYIATGIKDPGILKIGDSITLDLDTKPLPGYQDPLPTIFASIFPNQDMNYYRFVESLNKLRLNDPAIFIEPITNSFLGRGFNVGCLGLLHLEIFQERLRREFETDIIMTLPSVKYLVNLTDKSKIFIQNASELPPLTKIESIEEPIAAVDIFSSPYYLEKIARLIKDSRGEIKEIIYEKTIVKIISFLPLDEVIGGFYDELKSVSAGYASLRWQLAGYKKEDLVKLDILIAEEKEPSLSRIVHRSQAEKIGRKILLKLKELLPRQEFPIKLQAAINKRVIARETVPAIYKDIAGWLYGGDRTRKMKLWQKQKAGKKKLEKIFKGTVKIPNDVLLKILKIR
ncbi:MAG: elongation factor 4 [Candidatus Parcubacteria bacterium]|nr:MAG: elongation factor 4 [Candidatus Parcubacteria bacterium]